MCQQTLRSICLLDLNARGSFIDLENFIERPRRTFSNSQDCRLVLVRVAGVLVALFVIARSRTRTVGVGTRGLRRRHGSRERRQSIEGGADRLTEGDEIGRRVA